jgi:two-component system phosphate regulon response regulator PhoB
MLTAKSTETDQVVGLEIGADDYVTKPFGVQVLLARVKKLLQRAAAGAPAGSRALLRVRTLMLDRERQRVTVRGREVPLTSLEFRILAFLMERPGKVFTRDEVLNGAWKHEAFVTDRTVDVHIRSIRRKLGREAGEYIETVRGTGYRFREERP